MASRAFKNSLALLLLGVLSTAGALAAEGSAEPPFRFYSTVDGLTQSDVYGIKQDDTGYLWFTTARGLNRYDGKDFDHYTIKDGLRSNSLTAFAIGEDNTVWVGDTGGGISVIRSALVDQVIQPFGDEDTPIINIEIVGERVLVIAEGAGILEVVMDDGNYRLEPLIGESIGATNIAISGNDLWVASRSGLYRLLLNPEPELQLISEEIVHIYPAANGAVWAADRQKRIGIWKDGVLDVRAIIETADDLVCITIGAYGTVWAATAGELFSFDGRQANTVHTADTIRKYDGIDNISSQFVDRENTLWIASESRLIRFMGDRFRHFRLKTESDSETVWSISEDDEGRIWFGTQSRLIRREADETLTLVGPDQGIPRGAVRDIVRDDSGTMWAGIRGEGLYRVNTSSLQAQRVAGTEGLEILDVAVANDTSIWFSTFASGVFRYSPNTDVIERFPSPGNTSVYTLDLWDDNSVYYGADKVGLVHLIPQANGEYKQDIFGATNELLSVAFNQIRMISKNELWVATEEGGVYRFDTDHFVTLQEPVPWADQTIYLLEALGDGSLIVGGEQGLYQFLPGSSRIVHYNQLSGFTGTETNVHATFVDSRNFLWIGTVDGATRMDTSLPLPDYVEPIPRIVHMDTAMDGLPIGENAEIDPGQHGVHVEFTAVSLLFPSAAEYSYRLIGVQNQWSAATSNQTVNYRSIPPGSHEFFVKARYAGGEWSDEVASRRFTIKPFFWQQLWFQLFAILVFLLVLRAVMNHRTGNMERLNKFLRRQVAERTRSIEQARENLELSNQQLSSEINERRKADKAREDIELRFSRAFDNAPIGMGLLDIDGRMFDANPVMRNMFWPATGSETSICFLDQMDSDDRVRFLLQLEKLLSNEVDSLEERLSCTTSTGEVLQIVVHLSAVRADNDEFQYAVMQVQDITESLKLTGLLEYQASYDELTGLLNRRSFEAKLKQAWDKGNTGGQPNYLIFMDLDQFKVVNDTSGHQAGDQLLRDVSEILKDIVRANDSVCRLGGDEFGIILWNCPTTVAKRIAESIRAKIEDLRFRWQSEVYRIGVSIGGLPIDPAVGDTGELQQLADAACYAAKEAGRNRVHMVSGETDSARERRGQVRWVQRLREAMDSRRFAMYGQVIKPIKENTDELEHVEILLRLRDPETRKLVPPGAFLPAAERYGMSIELDQWVVKTLLDTLFIHQSFQSDRRKYWINLSGTSIGDTRFARFLVEAVQRAPLPPGTINFEITETAVIRSVVEARKLMTELGEMGCQFALDDFGSGLSSFGYLKKLPIDILKIDGMFIRDILHDETDRIFVKSIIDIAHALNIKTVAEFVENHGQYELMRELGTDYVQGFAVGRPFALAPHFPSFTEADQAAVIELQQAG
ncbi:MAG: EAL domain-containing protein [Gammaproteobacteria bacterium]|nr:EAL domain-containing protein [Gammaproteobacteria bacterium]